MIPSSNCCSITVWYSSNLCILSSFRVTLLNLPTVSSLFPRQACAVGTCIFLQALYLIDEIFMEGIMYILKIFQAKHLLRTHLCKCILTRVHKEHIFFLRTRRGKLSSSDPSQHGELCSGNGVKVKTWNWGFSWLDSLNIRCSKDYAYR